MAIVNVMDLFEMISTILVDVYNFVFNFLTYQFNFNGNVIQLWQILGVLGVGVVVIALIIKVIL